MLRLFSILALVAVLLIIPTDAKIITLQNGQCINNGTNSTICSVQFSCSQIRINATASCPQQVCEQRFNFSCPEPKVYVNSSFVEQPIFDGKQARQYAGYALLIGAGILLFAFRNKFTQKTKSADDKKVDFEDLK